MDENPATPLNPEELKYASMGFYGHEEIMGLDKHGNVVIWDMVRGHPFLNGQSVPVLDTSTWGMLECDRVERDAYALGRPFNVEPARIPGR